MEGQRGLRNSSWDYPVFQLLGLFSLTVQFSPWVPLFPAGTAGAMAHPSTSRLFLWSSLVRWFLTTSWMKGLDGIKVLPLCLLPSLPCYMCPILSSNAIPGSLFLPNMKVFGVVGYFDISLPPPWVQSVSPTYVSRDSLTRPILIHQLVPCLLS